MNLKIGLIGNHPGWEIVLNQEGVFYDIIKTPKLEYPVIIAPNVQTDINSYHDYVQSGGSLLLSTDSYKSIFGGKLYKTKTTFCLAAKDSIYSSVGIVDLFSEMKYPSALHFLDENLKITQKILDKSSVIIIPFDIDELIISIKSKRLKFYDQRPELPSEIVSNVSKAKIRKIIQLTLKHLLEEKELPFVQKRFIPKDRESVFIFRLDTDFCSAEDAVAILEVIRSHNIKSTWFIDTASEDRIKSVYSQMGDQEIGLHCHKHLVYSDYERNLENISTGLEKVKLTGYDVKGFAAPFGEWNENLARVIEEKSFTYSSEFITDYDNLPYFPQIDNKQSQILQIPIHPIGLGRLRRSHYTSSEMITYYKRIINAKLQLHEPIIIYHHPHHKYFDIYEEIFRFVNEHKMQKMTMLEYAEWWMKRYNLDLEIDFVNDELFVSNTDSTDIWLKISYQNRNSISPISARIILNEMRWNEDKRTPVPKDIARTRKFQWRDVLYNYETNKGKKKHENLPG